MKNVTSYFSLVEWFIFEHFYVRFYYFKVSFDFASFPKAAFFKAKAHRGSPKGGKVSLLFFSNRIGIFFINFYLAFNFFKVPFVFASLPKAALCNDRAHRGTPKGGKMSLLFFFNRMVFFHAFLRAISFYQRPFRFWLSFNCSILQD